MITRDELLMGRDKQYPLTSGLLANLGELLVNLNKFRQIYGKPMTVSSGYRPGKFNTLAGGAPNSSHVTCQAADFHDPDGVLDKFCVDNQDILAQCGLYLESPVNTPGWCHLQIRPPASGRRVFLAK